MLLLWPAMALKKKRNKKMQLACLQTRWNVCNNCISTKFKKRLCQALLVCFLLEKRFMQNMDRALITYNRKIDRRPAMHTFSTWYLFSPIEMFTTMHHVCFLSSSPIHINSNFICVHFSFDSLITHTVYANSC